MLALRRNTWMGMELINFVQKSFDWAALSTQVPEHLPAVVFEAGAEIWLEKAVQAFCEVLLPSAQSSLCAAYRDRTDASNCCLELVLHCTETREFVNPEWVRRLDDCTAELLCHSVSLRMTKEEQGLFFVFGFPVYGATLASIPHRNSILLVEDDWLVRRSVREVLESEGFRVLEVGTAEEALASFDRHHREIALVISDLTLPGRDGKYLANRLRSGSIRLPILLMSGYSHAITENMSERLFYLAKPFSSASLIEAVRRCLSGYHSAFMPTQSAPLCPGFTASW